MGLFISNCPGCRERIEWFIMGPPKNYVCKCGRAVSQDEIRESWKENYRRHIEWRDALSEDPAPLKGEGT